MSLLKLLDTMMYAALQKNLKNILATVHPDTGDQNVHKNGNFI